MYVIKKRFIILPAIAIAAVLLIFAIFHLKDAAGGSIEFIAHRGFNSMFPENTIYAAEQAVKMGFIPECDVQFTQDGVMVLMHDDTVDRTTNGTGIVKNLEYSYIDTLDAGSKFPGDYKGLKVPKFTDYLDAVKGAKHIYPELKTYRDVNDITTFTQTLIKYGYEGKATIQSFYYPTTLPYIRQVSKKIRVGALSSDQKTFDIYLAIAKSDPNSMMLISAKLATADNLAKCRDSNLQVAVWTIDDVSQMEKLIDIGYSKFICSKYIKPGK